MERPMTDQPTTTDPAADALRGPWLAVIADPDGFVYDSSALVQGLLLSPAWGRLELASVVGAAVARLLADDSKGTT
jgi:hypothetical protein